MTLNSPDQGGESLSEVLQPHVVVDPRLIEKFGDPAIDIAGLTSLFTDEIGLDRCKFPSIDLHQLNSLGQSPHPIDARYNSIGHTIHIDPTAAIVTKDPSIITRHIAWGATICRQVELHPVKARIPFRRGFVAKAAELATESSGLELYRSLITFPNERRPIRPGATIPRPRISAYSISAAGLALG